MPGIDVFLSILKKDVDGRVRPGERAVLFNCATGLKYEMPEAGTRLTLGEPVNWSRMRR